MPGTQGVRIAPILPARDLERSIAFYERMGFRNRSIFPRYAILQRDAWVLHLFTEDGHADGHGPDHTLYFVARDVDRLYAEFRAAGVEVRKPPEMKEWGVREFGLADPNDYELRFGEP